MSPILVDSLFSTAKFLLKVIPIFVLGVILAQLLIELRWLNKLSWLSRPLMRFGHLQPECGGSFMVALVSPTAGHSMLAKYYDERRIERRELIIAAILNTLPGVIAQGRTTLPVIIPLMGIFGLIYYGFLVLAGFIKAIILLAVGSLILPKRDIKELELETSSEVLRLPLKMALLNSLHNSKKTIFKILRTMIPVTFLVFLFIGLGVFNYVGTKIGIVAYYFPVPAESLPIVATRLASPIGAYTMAGNLLSKGVVTGKEIVIALLVGSLLATLANMRFVIPYYFGIFGPKIGTQLIFVSTLLRILVLIGIIGGLTILWL